MVTNLTNKWQIKLLPFVIVILTILVCSFLVIGSLYAFSINKKNDDLIDRHFEQNLSLNREWKSLDEKTLIKAILEEKAINYRYIQSINTNKYSVWIRFTSFLIGTILSFMGATFILSKISEKETTFSGDTPDINFNLKTSSPGIILVFFGCLLISFGIFKEIGHEFRDSPRYFGNSYYQKMDNLIDKYRNVDERNGNVLDKSIE